MFPPEAADTRPAVMFSNRLFSEEELANMVVSVRRDVPMLQVQRLTDVGVAVIPPVADRPVQRTVNRSVGWDDRMDEVSVLCWPVCDPPIRIYVVNAALTHTIRVCLLYPVGAGDLKGGSVGGRRLDHWRTIVWDPGIVDSRALSACYDCLCFMALFRAVMSLVHHGTEWSVWTGTDAGYCRTIAWEERYLPRLHPPCVVDRLCGHSTNIRVPGFVLMLNGDRNISPRRCACMRGTSLGVLSVGRIPLMMDLTLPRFEGLGDGPRQVHKPWKTSAESPASPDTSYVEDRRRSSSPCLNLDELSSSDDDTGGSVHLSDLSVTLLCGSDVDHTPVNSDQVLSDVDLPPEYVSNDKRQVIRIRDVSLDVQIVDVSQVGRAWDSRWTVSRGSSRKQMPLPLCIPATTTSGRDIDVTLGSSGPDPPPVVGTVAIPVVESVEAVKLSSPPLSGQLSPASPQTVAWEDMGDSSVPLSPNCVQAGRSQDVPDEGSLFRVSPVSPGFEQHRYPRAGVLLPTTLDDFSDSVLGDPITYAQCEQIPDPMPL